MGYAKARAEKGDTRELKQHPMSQFPHYFLLFFAFRQHSLRLILRYYSPRPEKRLPNGKPNHDSYRTEAPLNCA
jgi:hypothetical protein